MKKKKKFQPITMPPFLGRKSAEIAVLPEAPDSATSAVSSGRLPFIGACIRAPLFPDIEMKFVYRQPLA